jgi:hypothetical protein
MPWNMAAIWWMANIKGLRSDLARLFFPRIMIQSMSRAAACGLNGCVLMVMPIYLCDGFRGPHLNFSFVFQNQCAEVLDCRRFVRFSRLSN